MANSSSSNIRSLFSIAVAAVLGYGPGIFSDKANANEPAAAVSSHLEQAATSIIAAAKESIAAAPSDEDAADRGQLALEAIRILGMIGDLDADAQADKLLDELHASGRPAVVESLFQSRLTNNLHNWPRLDESQRARTIDGFVAHVQKTGMSVNQGRALIRMATMLGDGRDSALAIKAIKELLPTAKASSDETVGRMIATFEGTIKRLELPGKPLEIEGALLDGSQIDWAAYRGKVVLVDYFASWCGPCRDEVPKVVANYNAYHDKGFEVIGINLNTSDERDAVDEYIQQTGFNFPTLFSSDEAATGWDHPMAKRYGITAIPRAILVDKNGVVVSTSARGTRLGELLQDQLGPPPADSTSTTTQDSEVIQASATDDVAPAEPTDATPTDAREPEPTPLK